AGSRPRPRRALPGRRRCPPSPPRTMPPSRPHSSDDARVHQGARHATDEFAPPASSAGHEHRNSEAPRRTVRQAEPMNDVAMPGWKRNVGLFLAGQTISLFGSMVVMYAVMWHLTIETRSGSVLMLSIVFGMLPQAFVSIFGGVWADRHHRKFLIMGSDTVIALATLGLALLMAGGVDSLWVIYAALAVRSVFAGIQTPAVSAMIPQITPTDQLMRVNGMFQSIQSGMMLLAPALAAVIYASYDIVTVFFVDVVTALIGVGMLALVAVPRLVRTDDGGPVSYFGDLAAGMRYIRSNAPVRWLIVLFAIVIDRKSVV